MVSMSAESDRVYQGRASHGSWYKREQTLMARSSRVVGLAGSFIACPWKNQPIPFESVAQRLQYFTGASLLKSHHLSMLHGGQNFIPETFAGGCKLPPKHSLLGK